MGLNVSSESLISVPPCQVQLALRVQTATFCDRGSGKSHANLDRPGRLEVKKKMRTPAAAKTRSFATCIMRRNHSYSHRERGSENYDKEQRHFLYSELHPAWR